MIWTVSEVVRSENRSTAQHLMPGSAASSRAGKPCRHPFDDRNQPIPLTWRTRHTQLTGYRRELMRSQTAPIVPCTRNRTAFQLHLGDMRVASLTYGAIRTDGGKIRANIWGTETPVAPLPGAKKHHSPHGATTRE